MDAFLGSNMAVSIIWGSFWCVLLQREPCLQCGVSGRATDFWKLSYGITGLIACPGIQASSLEVGSSILLP